MNIKRITAVALLALTGVLSAAPLKIGWAINDISTDKPVELAGTFHWRHSKGLRDPLMATALAIDNGEDCVVFLSMDFISPPTFVANRVRKRVKREIPDLPPEKIIFHATHIHTGVSIGRTEKKLADEYGNYMVEQIFKSVKQAWESRQPGQIAYGYDLVVTAFNRRIVYFNDRKGGIGMSPRGKAVLHGRSDVPDFSHVEGGADPFANYLFTYDMDGKLTGAIINVGYTAQVSISDRYVSSDTWHDMRKLMAEHHPGVFILPQVAAAGEATFEQPYYKAAEKRRYRLIYGREPAYPGEFQRKQIAGRILTSFDRAHSWAQKEKFSDLPIKHVVRTLKLDPSVPSKVDYEAAKDGLKKIAELRKNPKTTERMRTSLNGRGNVCKRVVKSYENADKLPRVPMEFHVLRIGDVAFVSERFEYYFEFGQRIQARSPFIQTFTIQLAASNGPGGYLATERASANGGYGTRFLCPVSPKGGQEIVEAAVKELKALKAMDKPAKK